MTPQQVVNQYEEAKEKFHAELDRLNKLYGVKPDIVCTKQSSRIALLFDYDKLMYAAHGSVINVNKIQPFDLA